jgi:hypothetical protein
MSSLPIPLPSLPSPLFPDIPFLDVYRLLALSPPPFLLIYSKEIYINIAQGLL